jgi:uncharacterized cupin superfamily protein
VSHLVHWEDIEPHERRAGEAGGLLWDLGGAAGSVGVGLRRTVLEPGRRTTPPHAHGAEEEIFYVLGGSGLLWQDGEVCELRAGDCAVHLPMGAAHTIRAGDDGLDVLAFGAREYFTSAELPRGRSMWSIRGYIEIQDGHPWDREPELVWPEPEPERPRTIVNVADVEPEVRGGRRRRFVGDAAGSRWTGLTHIECDAGVLSGPPHVHTAEEELFVVLEGDGTLELWPDERNPVRRGSVVARPPGSGVAHAFRGGEEGLILLAWGTREPNDVCWYPRSRKMFWRGADVIGRIEHLDYWEGEELE